MEDLVNNKLYSLNRVLQQMQKTLECTICLDLLEDPITTKCGHSFCRQCLDKVLSGTKGGCAPCPLCLTSNTKRSLTKNEKIIGLVFAVRKIIEGIKEDCGFGDNLTKKTKNPAHIDPEEPSLPEEKMDAELPKGLRRGMRKREQTMPFVASKEPLQRKKHPPTNSGSEGSNSSKGHSKPVGAFELLEIGTKSSRNFDSSTQSDNLRALPDKKVPTSSKKGMLSSSRAKKWTSLPKEYPQEVQLSTSSSLKTTNKYVPKRNAKREKVDCPPLCAKSPHPDFTSHLDKVSQWLDQSHDVNFGISVAKRKVSEDREKDCDASLQFPTGKQQMTTDETPLPPVPEPDHHSPAKGVTSVACSQVSTVLFQPSQYAPNFDGYDQKSPPNDPAKKDDRLPTNPKPARAFGKLEKENKLMRGKTANLLPPNTKTNSSRKKAPLALNTSDTNVITKTADLEVSFGKCPAGHGDPLGKIFSGTLGNNDRDKPLMPPPPHLSPSGGGDEANKERTVQNSAPKEGEVKVASRMKSKLLDESKTTVSVGKRTTKSPGWSHFRKIRRDLRSRRSSLTIKGGEEKPNESGAELCPDMTATQETDIIIDEKSQASSNLPLGKLIRKQMSKVNESDLDIGKKNKMPRSAANPTGRKRMQGDHLKLETSKDVAKDLKSEDSSKLRTKHQAERFNDLTGDQSTTSNGGALALCANGPPRSPPEKNKFDVPLSETPQNQKKESDLQIFKTCIASHGQAHQSWTADAKCLEEGEEDSPVSKQKKNPSSEERGRNFKAAPCQSSRGATVPPEPALSSPCFHLVPCEVFQVLKKYALFFCNADDECNLNGKFVEPAVAAPAVAEEADSHGGKKDDLPLNDLQASVRSIESLAPNLASEAKDDAQHFDQDRKLPALNTNDDAKVLLKAETDSNLKRAKSDSFQKKEDLTVFCENDQPSLRQEKNEAILDHIQTEQNSLLKNDETEPKKVALNPPGDEDVPSGKGDVINCVFSSDEDIPIGDTEPMEFDDEFPNSPNLFPCVDSDPPSKCKSNASQTATSPVGSHFDLYSLPLKEEKGDLEDGPSKADSPEGSPEKLCYVSRKAPKRKKPGRCSSRVKYKRIHSPASSNSNLDDEEPRTRPSGADGEMAHMQLPKEGSSEPHLDLEEVRDLGRYDENIWGYFDGSSNQTGLKAETTTEEALQVDENVPSSPLIESIDLLSSEDEFPATAEAMNNVHADMTLIKKMRRRNGGEEASKEGDFGSQASSVSTATSVQPLTSSTLNLFKQCNDSLHMAESILKEKKKQNLSRFLFTEETSDSHSQTDLAANYENTEDLDSMSHSSAFSSQSGFVTTQKRNKVQEEVSDLKEQIDALEREAKNLNPKRDEPKESVLASTEVPPDELVEHRPKEESKIALVNEEFSDHESDQLFVSLQSQPLMETEAKLPNCPEKSLRETGAARPFVLVCTGLTAKEVDQVDAFVGCLCGGGSKLEKSWGPSVTHVIVKTDSEGMTERTFKYLYGIARRLWVVSFSWILDSLKSSSLLPEENYEAMDCSGAAAANKARLLSPPIFAGCQFCLLPPFSDLSQDQLMELVSACGAVIIKDPSSFLRGGQNLQLIIAGLEEADLHTVQDYLEKFNAVTVAQEWIIECLGNYELLPLGSYILGCPGEKDFATCCIPESLLQDEEI